MNPTKVALIAAVQAEAKRVRADTAAALDRVGADEDQRAAVICQNVLRTCMEAALNDALPFTPALLIEIGIRLASYSVSALPVDVQEAAIATLARALPDAHRARMAAGVMISTTWDVPGTSPKGATLQ